jgi:hypothetical protein
VNTQNIEKSIILLLLLLLIINFQISYIYVYICNDLLKAKNRQKLSITALTIHLSAPSFDTRYLIAPIKVIFYILLRKP